MPFRAITGHRPLLELLARATARGTLPPSLIFAGAEGVGKRRTAMALAQALNCEKTEDRSQKAEDGSQKTEGRSQKAEDGSAGFDACGECTACRRIARGVHADVL